jgi:KipI family sensor histidine kinase inhibitor
MSTGENSSIKPPVSPIVMFGLRRPNGSRLYFRLARVWTSVKVVPASDSSLLVVLGDAISLDNHERVMSLFRALDRLNDPRIRNLHPAYASILIDFDPLLLSHEQAVSLIENVAGEESSQYDRAANTVTIPVCYDIEFAPDLHEVANHAKISTREVIRLHASATYRVHFLGFTPGFAYLGGLPDTLHTPRLATPRKHVPAGSVAIAGTQAGIYPVDSQGGWRLIGRTPVRIFDPGAAQPTQLKPGDLVEFSVIDRATFDATNR